MTILHALRRGVTDLQRSRRMLLVFYAAATLPALIGAAVVMTVPLSSLGHSTWSESMWSSVEPSWIAEMIAQSTLPAMPILVALLGLASLARLLHVFLLGGALQVFATGRPYATEFFAGCGRNFWRIVRLALFSLLFFAAAVGVQSGLNSAGTKIWGEGNEATPLIHWSWFTYTVLAVLLGICSLAFDYAAIRLVTEDSFKAVRAYLGAFRMIWRAPGRTIGLYVMIWLIALLWLGVYQGISLGVPQTSVALVFVLFIVRQFVVIARTWTRLLFYSSACAMYADLCPSAPLVVPEPEPTAEQMALPPAEIVETSPES